MPRGSDLSDFVRGQIYALRFYANWDIKQISNTLTINYECVKKYCQRSGTKRLLHQSCSTDRKRKCGRHYCTTARVDRAIIRPVIADPFSNAASIQRQLGDITNCSTQTVRRRLDKAGYKQFVPAHKTRLTQRHKDQRLQWSIEHLNWTALQWNSVLFSDESKFEIQRHHVRYVRRRIGERYKDENVEPQGNRGIGSVMVWSAFGHHGFTDVVIVDGRINADDYIALLQEHLLPRYRELVPDGGYFMQDNAPIHNAHRTLTFLQEHNVNVLPWPSLSPDMNPIENVWAICKTELRNRHVENVAQLTAAIREIWTAKLNDQLFRDNLCESMIQRVRQLHIARGSYTRY